MSQNDFAATSANIQMLIASGLHAPVEVVDLVDHTRELTGTARLRVLLEDVHMSAGRTDAQADRLAGLREQLTPAQVWHVLRKIARADDFAIDTKVHACIRAGLLPHDVTVTELFSDAEPAKLVTAALNGAMDIADLSGCSIYQRAFAAGEMTTAELEKSGHAGCVLLNQFDVLGQVARHLPELPVQKKLAWLFDRGTFSTHARGPVRGRELDDRLVDAMHTMLSESLSATPAYGDAWVATVEFMMNSDRAIRKSGVTPDQVARLQAEHPGLATDLLLVWLDVASREQVSEMIVRHVLPFVTTRYWDVPNHDEWIGQLVDAGHPAVGRLSGRVLEEVVVDAGKLMSVPWSVRKDVVALRGEWLTRWLRHPEVNPEEVRELVQDGQVTASSAVRVYADVTPAVAVELLETKGLAAWLAEELGRDMLRASWRAGAVAVLNAVIDLMPQDENLRARLLARVLTARKDGRGPLDGDARIAHGLNVLAARWAERDARHDH